MLGSAEFKDSVVVADLEAGIGTLTRLPDGAVDLVVVVTEPTAKSLDVARRATEAAGAKGVSRIAVVANKVTGKADMDAVRQAFPDAEVTEVPEDRAIEDAERRGESPLDAAPDAPAVRALVDLGKLILQPE